LDAFSPLRILDFRSTMFGAPGTAGIRGVSPAMNQPVSELPIHGDRPSLRGLLR
jgi:hypothetical protein